MNTNINRLLILACIVGLIILTAMVITQRASGSAPSGLPASVASSSAQVIGTTQRLLFATSTCSARVISTRTQPMMLGFGVYGASDFVPTATTGVLQPASTTVVYDSGQYGCGAVRVISGTVTGDTIHVLETN
jgi:hypothetical protein